NEKRIAGPLILAHPLSKVLEIDIRTEKINLWCACAPDVHQVRKRPSAGILSWLITRSYQRRVHKHWQGVFTLTGVGDPVHKTGKIPGHKDLICCRTLAEDFFPRTPTLETIRRPHGAKLRNELFFVLLQIV